MRSWFETELTEPDERIVAAFMRDLAGAAVADLPRLPTPDVLWWKAQLLARWNAERKATAPLDVVEPFQIAAGLATAALILLWALPSLRHLIMLG